LIREIRRLTDEEKLDVAQQLVRVAKVPVQELLDSRQLHFMSFSELAEADRQGFDIQLHTHNHLLNLERPTTVVDEIATNRRKLDSYVTSPLRHFCYPGGHFSREMFPLLEAMEIASATSTQPGLNTSTTDKFALFRILDGEGVSDLEMEAELAGFMELTRRIKRFVFPDRHRA
jgi:peptidoglycan/xylan/chitin deacetylase (PgdA/CDA1 family)